MVKKKENHSSEKLEEKAKLKELEEKIKKCEALKSEYLAGWQRARADFLNYRKREQERMEEFVERAKEEWFLKILPILDNFNLIEKNLPEDLKKNEHVKGILQVKLQIENLLKQEGIEEIKTFGEKFDPNLHEVVEEVEVKDKESGTIVEEVQKGYKINNRLLRAAKVKVAK